MNTTITHHLKLSHYFQHVGIISGCLLIFLIFALLFPLDLQSTYADELATQSDTPSISLALDQELTLNITPTAAGATSTTSSNFTVSTSSNAGYKIYLDTLDPTANLTNVDSTKSNSYVSALPTPTSLANLPANTWGFALTSDPVNSHTTFSGPTDSTTPIISTEESAARDVYHFTLAANLDTSLPAGQYANTLLVSAIANPETITGLRSLIYMQDMTSDICTQSAIHDEKQLIDLRDNQSYWVAKLKDNQCWMVQNLAYDIPSTGLTSQIASQSDINQPNSVWTSLEPGLDVDGATKAPPVATTNSKTIPNPFPFNNTGTDSFNLGKYVYATPGSSQNCPSGAQSGARSFSECPNGFVDVSAAEWQPTHTVQSGIYRGASYSYVAVDEAAKTYDPHYLVGNFYQWNAATAGSGGKTTSFIASDSICPKNWRLPTATPIDNNDFSNLFTAYNLQAWVADLYYPPLSFVQSGLVRYSGEFQDFGGSLSLYSSSPSPNVNVSYEGYPGAGFTIGLYRANALAVRCLAR